MTGAREFLVGGEWRASNEILDVRFPYTRETVGRVCLAGSVDIEDALRSAAAGFSLTRHLPAHRRSEILYALADLLREHAAEFVETIVLEAGKTRALAEGEVLRARETIEVSAEEARRIDGTILPIDWNEGGEGRIGCIRRFPLGPVLAITPFNFPLNLACHKLGPAIAAGDSIVLKPASATPISALMFGELMLDAGFPPAAISVVPCRSELAERMVQDDRIACLSFTGSPAIGWHLRGIAGRKRVGLELGGNAAVIVHEDADIPFAVGRIVAGGFSNAGQACISVQRVLVHRDAYERFIAEAKSAAESLVPGDPMDPATTLGPMIDAGEVRRVDAWVREAAVQGATIVTGGSPLGERFYLPTILVGCEPRMKVWHEEVFGPVLAVRAYDDFGEAVRMVNDSKYGLQAGVFTRDIHLALEAARKIECGGVILNDTAYYKVGNMPYGGMKQSGFGREGGKYAVREMSEEKIVVVNQ